MDKERIYLTINAERLGTVSEVVDFLNDLKIAYDSLLAFDFLVNTLRYDLEKKGQNYLPNLLLFQKDISKTILPSENLFISRVNIQSPGFWEVFGLLNPLQQIREFLNDRHERKKDRQYRVRQAEIIGDLEISEKKNRILQEQINILKSLGYSEIEIRQIVSTMVFEPLKNLGKHQDLGQIERPDQNE